MTNDTRVVTRVSFSYTLISSSRGTRYRVHHLLRGDIIMSDTSRWGTVKDAAAMLGVHTMTIRRYINAGELPARRKGIKLIEVDLWAVRKLMTPVEPTVTRTGTYAGNGAGQ